MQANHPQSREVNVRPDSEAAPRAEPVSDMAPRGHALASQELELVERVATALTASARAEAALRGLFRTVKFLGASVGAARETNEALVKELGELHALLGEPGVPRGERMTERALEARAHFLEQALGEITEQAVQEREFLIAEHDNFIASLLNDHEKEASHLRRRLLDAERKLAAREARDFDFDWDDDK